ncbi:Voltage-dependent T-type calcium channel subunit alpha-1H [Bienertia sinuspersici]
MEAEVVRLNELDGRSLNYRGSSSPSLEPQLIFKYPPGKKLPMRVKDLCAFSFPGGVKVSMQLPLNFVFPLS